MRILSHPFRIDPSGAVATIEDWTDRELTQIVQAVTSTAVGERPLAPLFGMADPTGRTVTSDEVKAAVHLCEPDVRVLSVASRPASGGRRRLEVAAVWIDDEE